MISNGIKQVLEQSINIYFFGMSSKYARNIVWILENNAIFVQRITNSVNFYENAKNRKKNKINFINVFQPLYYP